MELKHTNLYLCRETSGHPNGHPDVQNLFVWLTSS